MKFTSGDLCQLVPQSLLSTSVKAFLFSEATKDLADHIRHTLVHRKLQIRFHPMSCAMSPGLPLKQLTSRSSNLILSASQEGEVKRADDSPPNHRPLLQELVNGIAELDTLPRSYGGTKIKSNSFARTNH